MGYIFHIQTMKEADGDPNYMLNTMYRVLKDPLAEVALQNLYTFEFARIFY